MPLNEAEPGSFNAGVGILNNRKAVIAALLFCLWAASTNWRSAMRGIRVSHSGFDYFGHHFSHDPVYIFGLVFSIWISGTITFRSPLRADRFLFSMAAFSFSLLAITQFLILSAVALRTVRAADAIVWTVAAAICIATLAGWNKQDKQAVSSD
jgi:hypothetical protein